jgi:uncharacterized protein (DUF433 family)
LNAFTLRKIYIIEIIIVTTMRTEINEYIVIDNEIGHGKPTFKGTRIMVHTILEMLAAGAGIKDVLKAYPSLNPDHIKAALKYASKVTEGSSRVVPI